MSDGIDRNGAALSVRDLGKTYGKRLFSRKGFRALDGVSLEVQRGSVFGLLGPNGAGKTTLIKIVLGLVRGYHGEALLSGMRPRDPASRRRAGFLPESHRLPPYLTGREVVRLFGMMSGMDRRELDAKIPRLLELVGMEKSADRKIREYSKGMQQRIGLAQALAHDPEIVFLDEPTDGVDPVGRAAIRGIVEDLKRRGVTVFINSHLLMEVELVCDRVAILSKGKLVREGSVDELTPRTGKVRFILRDPVADAAAIVTGLGHGFLQHPDGFELSVNEGELDATIDRLRLARVGIREITQRRLTLEESFIGLVGKEQG
jgi:ABC-2 type transport system ATP-binding protein